MHLVLDITLTVAKPWLHQPSGIDRVEFAHTRHWRSLPSGDVTFVMRNGWNRLAAIPDAIARTFLEEADRRIAPGMSGRWGLRARSGALMYAQWWGLGRGLLRRRLAARPDSVFLTVSCATLHMEPALRDLRAQGCRVVPLIHDVIPLTHPQYFPAKEPPRHARRIEALAQLADAGLIVSDAALAALRDHAARAGLVLPPMTVAHPGLDLPAAAAAAAPADDPYFVMLGSIEPRKNHLLMLQLWQAMARVPGTPRLVILGRRPSAPHLATIMLDRTDFAGRVQDRGRLPDAEVAALLRGARALLFPSITEGFGIPLAEALAAGVPVIASDIPAFREVGGAVPDYLDPLDGAAWRAAVLDYASPGSPRREAQLARLDSWQAPSWAAHFQAAERLLRGVAARPPASLVAGPIRSMASPRAR